MTAKLCLNMIVKNEAHVIARCLDAARPHIDRWCIVDTGSTDGTQAKIRELLQGIPGELHERPWVHFAHNRSEALTLAKAGGGHALFLDADDVLAVEEGSPRPKLGVDAYHLTIHVGEAFAFSRVGIVDLAKPWRWEGVVHEYLECAEGYRVELLPGWHVRSISDSARNREGSKKYLRDAVVLESALVDAPENARYVFYLAQSYRDGLRPDRALPFYEKRAIMGGFEEEAWYALYQVAAMHEALGRIDAALTGYLAAFDRRPSRAEPLCAAARLARLQKRWGSALTFARTAAAIAPPKGDVLFIDESVYRWRALDEYAVAASWTGAFAEAVSVFEHLLAGGTLPAGERARIEGNLAHCKKQLGA
jgi:glycosyltransferase involved in cell wall biosynthesis